MTLLVKKFGGSSLANLKNIQKVADILAKSHAKGDHVIAVVSAMEGVTNNLVSLVKNIAPHLPFNEESDVVLASGEQISAGLLARALQGRGLKACSWMAWQLPIWTCSSVNGADILSIEEDRLKKNLEEGIIPVVAGFQGVNKNHRLTILGREGSDTTAVALAASLKADACYIYTDVDGVYNADPKMCSTAQPYDQINYKDMLFLAQHGAKILHDKAVALAESFDMPIHVLSTFDPEGHQTKIVKEAPFIQGIAKKDVLSWEIPSITPQEVETLYNHLQKEKPFLFFDWQIAPEGLRFLTSPEARHDVMAHLPKKCKPKECTLLTLLGFAPHEIPGYESLKVDRYIFFPRGIGLLVEPSVASVILNNFNERLGYGTSQ